MHALERTSPKGEGSPFIGKCIKCGEAGLTISAGMKECKADSIVSDEQALLYILNKED